GRNAGSPSVQPASYIRCEPSRSLQLLSSKIVSGAVEASLSSQPSLVKSSAVSRGADSAASISTCVSDSDDSGCGTTSMRTTANLSGSMLFARVTNACVHTSTTGLPRFASWIASCTPQEVAVPPSQTPVITRSD